MRILYVIDSLCGGGAEKLMNDMIPIINKKHYCELIILYDKNDKYSDSLRARGIKVTKVEAKSKLGMILFINNYIRNGRFDIVHSNLFPANYICAFTKLFKKEVSPLLITTEHNTDNRRRHIRLLRYVEKFVYSFYDHVISISDETQVALLKWLGQNKSEKYSVIYNGIDVEKFEHSQPYEKKDICSNYQEGDILLCMIGSFTEQKNHLFMIEVMKLLPTKYKLLLLGEGTLKNVIQKKVYEYGLDQRVFLMGFRTDVDRIIRSSDIIVIPSKWEGFGLIAVEAMACKKNIVASDVPGLSQVMGNVGVKVKVDDVNDFVRAIIISSQDLENKLNKDKIFMQAKKYDIKIMCENYIKLYSKLVENKSMR